MALFELLALVPIRKVLTVLPCRLNDVKKNPLDRNCFFYQDFLFRHHSEKLKHTVVFLPRSPSVVLLSYSEV